MRSPNAARRRRRCVSMVDWSKTATPPSKTDLLTAHSVTASARVPFPSNCVAGFRPVAYALSRRIFQSKVCGKVSVIRSILLHDKRPSRTGKWIFYEFFADTPSLLPTPIGVRNRFFASEEDAAKSVKHEYCIL